MRTIVRATAAALALIASVISIAITPGAASAAASDRDVKTLAKSTYVYIATVRKDGNQSKSAPVWFITAPDNSVLIETLPTSWKAKRIKRGSPALIWIGSKDGPSFIGKAEIVSDAKLQNQIIEDYPRKYVLARIGFARPTRQKFDDGTIVAIRITPIQDLPNGTASQPGTPAPKLAENGAAAQSSAGP